MTYDDFLNGCPQVLAEVKVYKCVGIFDRKYLTWRRLDSNLTPLKGVGRWDQHITYEVERALRLIANLYSTLRRVYGIEGGYDLLRMGRPRIAHRQPQHFGGYRS